MSKGSLRIWRRAKHTHTHTHTHTQEPEPFEGELNEDDYVEGEFEDLEESNFVGADDDLDFDLLADDDLNEEDGGTSMPAEGVAQR